MSREQGFPTETRLASVGKLTMVGGPRPIGDDPARQVGAPEQVRDSRASGWGTARVFQQELD